MRHLVMKAIPKRFLLFHRRVYIFRGLGQDYHDQAWRNLFGLAIIEAVHPGTV